jgi:hypothetical protein
MRGGIANHRSFKISAAMTALCAFLALTSTGRSSSWKNKDWTQWTKEDCQQILSDSPWASTIAIRDFNAQNRVGTSGPTALIVSSLVVRQAILRLDQLGPQTTFVPGQPQRVDYQQEDAECLSEKFGDRIVVRFSESSIFKTPPNLMVSGRKVPALPGFRANSDTCSIGGPHDVSYPKVVNGKPVFQPDKSKLVIDTKLNIQPTQSERPGRDDSQFIPVDTRFEFSMKNMVYKGKPDF